MRYTYIHVGETHIYLKMVFLLRMMVNLVSVDASDGVSHTHKVESTAATGYFLHQVLRGSCSTPFHGSPKKSSLLPNKAFLVGSREL